MAQALSMDLRTRVVAAIGGGLSRRAAAERFGVSAATAIRWDQRRRMMGDVRPKAQGGDRRSARIEAHADLILAKYEESPDITFAEMQAFLAARGLRFSTGALCRFCARHQLTRKKRRPTQRSRPAPTS
jgi:transposase